MIQEANVKVTVDTKANTIRFTVDYDPEDADISNPNHNKAAVALENIHDLILKAGMAKPPKQKGTAQCQE